MVKRARPKGNADGCLSGITAELYALSHNTRPEVASTNGGTAPVSMLGAAGAIELDVLAVQPAHKTRRPRQAAATPCLIKKTDLAGRVVTSPRRQGVGENGVLVRLSLSGFVQHCEIYMMG